MNKPLLTYLSAISFLTLPLAPASAQVSPIDLQLNGSAALQTGALVRLTPALNGLAGSAFVPVTLGQGGSFHTSFSFQITNGGTCGDGINFDDPDGIGADGIVFVIQNSAAGLKAIGDGGGAIGYGNLYSGQGISPSLGVEFDTFEGDPDGNNVGIDLDGSMDSVATVPISYPPRLNDGIPFYVWVDYNGAMLEVRLNTENTRPAIVTLSYNIVDLSARLGNTNVYAGFTAGTGGACGDHDILTWNWDYAPSPIHVTIDIKPGSYPNSINPISKGKTPVAIVTTGPSDNVPAFDATTVNPATVRFGAMGTEAAPVQHALEDVDGDGDTDLILHFNTQITGIKCGDNSATLTSETFDGQKFTGTDSIRTIPCH